MWKDPFFVIVSSFLILGHPSYASSLSQTNGTQGSSPSTSPGSGLGLSGGGKSVGKPRDDVSVNHKGSEVSDVRLTASEACRDESKLSACLGIREPVRGSGNPKDESTESHIKSLKWDRLTPFQPTTKKQPKVGMTIWTMTGRKATGNPPANGLASKSGAAIARNGWEDNWDD